MFVFLDGPSCVQEIIDIGISLARSVVTSGDELVFGHPRLLERHWSQPKEGFVKLNTDGVVFSSMHCSSIGGVIRDATRAWQCGFTMTLGESSIL